MPARSHMLALSDLILYSASVSMFRKSRFVISLVFAAGFSDLSLTSIEGEGCTVIESNVVISLTKYESKYLNPANLLVYIESISVSLAIV